MPKPQIINCPEPCEIRIITRFREGVVIHTHHFDQIRNRRVLHETFISYECLIPNGSPENLPSIETHHKQIKLTTETK